MGKKAAKSTRKFAQSGQLKKTIQARRKHQEIKRKSEKRRGKTWKGRAPLHEEDDIEEDDEVVDDDAEGLDSLRCVFCELCLLVDSYLTTDPRTPLWTIS